MCYTYSEQIGGLTMENKVYIGYARVSTAEQNEVRQLVSFDSFPFQISKGFIDKCSGKNMNRPQLQAMLEYVREGDAVVVSDFSRLARSTRDMLQIVHTKREVHYCNRCKTFWIGSVCPENVSNYRKYTKGGLRIPDASEIDIWGLKFPAELKKKKQQSISVRSANAILDSEDLQNLQTITLTNIAFITVRNANLSGRLKKCCPPKTRL